jgi:hypothetical protein
MNLPELLWRHTQEVLAMLGEPTMQSLVWHAGKSGAATTPQDFDIVKFSEALHDMIGEGADIIFSIVADRLAAELKITPSFEHSANGLERVLKIIESAKEVGR